MEPLRISGMLEFNIQETRSMGKLALIWQSPKASHFFQDLRNNCPQQFELFMSNKKYLTQSKVDLD